MTKGYWLTNSNRSQVKRFIKNTKNKDKFFEYMFIDTGKIIGTFGKDPPLMQRREELRIESAREEWKKLLSQGWRTIEEVWG